MRNEIDRGIPLLPKSNLHKRRMSQAQTIKYIDPKGAISNLASLDSLNSSEYISLNNEKNEKFDYELFAGKNVLKSLLIISAGPFLAQIALSLYGMVNMFWVAKAIGDNGISAIGAVVIVEFFANSIAVFLNTCIAVQISYLHGIGKIDTCSQLFIDFIRVCLILGIVVPCITLPCSKYLVEWFGAEGAVEEMAFQYLIPSQCGSFFLFLFYTVCGFLESTGHTWLYAFVQIAAFCLNMALFNPLLLLVFRTPIWGASLSTIISESIPTMVIVVLAFLKKYEIEPKMKMFCMKFVKDTGKALTAGIADLIEAFSIDFSLIIMEKFIVMAADAADALDPVLGVWSIIDKLEQVISCVSNGIGVGLLPLASYAYGARDYKRLMKLMFHSLWIMCAWAAVISLVLIIFPRQISTLWSHDESFLYWAEKMIRIYAYTGILTCVDYTIPIMLMAMQRPCAASCVSVFALLIPQPICAIALYYSKKDDPSRIIWTFDISDLFSLVIGIIFMIKPILEIRKIMKQKEEKKALESKSETLMPSYLKTPMLGDNKDGQNIEEIPRLI